jgi:membrane protein
MSSTREHGDRAAVADGNARADDRSADAPKSPSGLPAKSWGGVFKRTFTEFRQDNLTDLAAALTYYGVLAIFPAIIALVSILGLIGHSATQPLIENLGKVAPGPAKSIFTSAVQNLNKSQGAAGILFILGLAGALWSASGYVAAFMRASNTIYDVEEGRPIWKTLPVRIGVTVVMVLLLAISSVAVVLTGGLAKQVGNLVGVGSSAVQVWDIAKWPVLVLIVSFMLAILYWAAPNVKHPGFRWISPGGILAVAAWLIASAAFALYVANFSSYNKTYGALAAVVVFLVWLWISNIAILLGAEFNAELERGRFIEAGNPPGREPFIEPRDTRKMKADGAERAEGAGRADGHQRAERTERADGHQLAERAERADGRQRAEGAGRAEGAERGEGAERA